MSSTAPAPASGRTENRVGHLGLLFATLMIVMFMASLSQMVFSTALPTIVGELNGVDHMMWVITGYMLASTVMMPVYGKAGDLFGRKPAMLVAIALFTAGSIVGGLAPSMTVLIVARVLQGLGGGGLMILSQASVADFVPARDRGRYMGMMGAVFAVSSVAGPLLGGWLTEGPGWRWVFWITLPMAALAVAAIIWLMPGQRPAITRRPRIDTLGIALMAGATTAIVLIATWGGRTYEWASPQIIGLALAALVLGTAFVSVEARAEHPVIPLGLFANRNFVLVTAVAMVTGIAMFGTMAYMPTYFQMAEGVSATEAGLLLTPLMGAMLVTSVVVGALVSRTGHYKVAPILGSVVLAAGLWLLSTITLTTSVAQIGAYLAIIGVGLGASMQILTLIVQNEFPHRVVGTATAANNYFRQVGSSLGTAIVGSLFVSRLGSLLLERLPQASGQDGATNSLTPDRIHTLPEPVQAIILAAYHDALVPIFAVLAPLGLVAAVLMLFVRETPLATDIAHEIPAESLAEGEILITEFDQDDPDVTRARSPR
jgi:EmrB/QacA subfamily drug resistance transporter